MDSSAAGLGTKRRGHLLRKGQKERGGPYCLCRVQQSSALGLVDLSRGSVSQCADVVLCEKW